MGFTFAGNPITAVAATGYRGRVYLIKNANLYYSALLAVTGACTNIDMTAMLEMPGTGLLWIGVLTDSGNKPTASMLAMGTDRGEVLVYSGDNPGSPDWEMVARLKIPPVLNYQPILEINGDIWIATTTGIVSLRRLLQAGEDDIESTLVTQALSPYWRKLVERCVLNYKNIKCIGGWI